MMADTRTYLQPDSPQVLAAARRSGLPTAHCYELGRQLPVAMASLWRRHAAEVPDGDLDAYVSFGWLAWSGGALVLTPMGSAIHDMSPLKVTA
jgi:hypothetical protein